MAVRVASIGAGRTPEALWRATFSCRECRCSEGVGRDRAEFDPPSAVRRAHIPQRWRRGRARAGRGPPSGREDPRPRAPDGRAALLRRRAATAGTQAAAIRCPGSGSLPPSGCPPAAAAGRRQRQHRASPHPTTRGSAEGGRGAAIARAGDSTSCISQYQRVKGRPVFFPLERAEFLGRRADLVPD